MTFGHCDMRS